MKSLFHPNQQVHGASESFQMAALIRLGDWISKLLIISFQILPKRYRQRSEIRVNQEAPISGIGWNDYSSNSLQNCQLFHPGIPAHLDEVMIFNGQLSNRLEILTSVVIRQWFFGFKIQTHGDIIDRDCLDWKPWF